MVSGVQKVVLNTLAVAFGLAWVVFVIVLTALPYALVALFVYWLVK